MYIETRRMIIRNFTPVDADDLHQILGDGITKSVALMKKLGFQLEGIQRSQVRDLQGNWTDLHLYGLLADDWLQARA